MVDSVFLLSVSTIFAGVIGLGIKYCLKSKCNDVDCCFGCIRVQRDVRAEIELEEQQLEHGIPPESPTSRI
jgi:hypothetical protein